ncbi:MAG: SMC-Scp complex subunit ScpB [Alphaproteobacteria bacterium]
MSTEATTIQAETAGTVPDEAALEPVEGEGEGANPFGEPDTAEEIEARALRILEALLFAASQPMNEAALAQYLPDGIDLRALLDRLAALYQGHGVTLAEVAGGYAFRTAPDLARHLTIYRSVTRRFSRAALEALAIIAYHQPITRAEIETIRGVSLSRGTLDQLLEAEWIKPKGRRAVPGRPVTWVTTPEFLSHFGLASLDDLPGVEELRASGLLEPVTAGLPSDETADEDAGDEDRDSDEDDDEPLSDA